ncbi:MAG: hypothetical protein VYA69_01420 [Gemmatimonadota bacterium]|nr:hypothetical protein [Gemmatimonadota bacterium]
MVSPFGSRGTQTRAFHEPLPGLDDDARVIRYSIDDGPEAVARVEVSGDVGRVSVDPVTGTNHTFVLWSLSLDRGSDGVAEFYNPIYQLLFSDPKATNR